MSQSSVQSIIVWLIAVHCHTAFKFHVTFERLQTNDEIDLEK